MIQYRKFEKYFWQSDRRCSDPLSKMSIRTNGWTKTWRFLQLQQTEILKKLKKYLSELTRIIDDTKERNLFSVSGTQFLRHNFFFVSSLMWENYLRALTFKRKKKKNSVSSSRLKKNYFASKPRVQKSKPQFHFFNQTFYFPIFCIFSSI